MAISKIGTTSKEYKNVFITARVNSIEVDEDGNKVEIQEGGDSTNDLLLKLINKINELVDKVNSL